MYKIRAPYQRAHKTSKTINRPNKYRPTKNTAMLHNRDSSTSSLKKTRKCNMSSVCKETEVGML